MLKFELGEHEFIELNKLLKALSLVGTGGEASFRIVNGEVTVNGVTAAEKRKKIRPGDKVGFAGKTIVVSQ